ncbi:GGDEF domain-containing protein [Saccharophagus degradans]|uniref:diguanylate cyclase n=1 Tax=Saccharophagus degradans TaxID=86304 RepID=A0AAW7XBB4_9GAMM|nr:GGDEF domain-containing protein [Saccharophagus degradans]MDO6424201.1 GGDEF domain-containing protein [Saccharophagus degradans]MDO6608248.1 GGDEF domain-containing protein [Saccharophagus degradans]
MARSAATQPRTRGKKPTATMLKVNGFPGENELRDLQFKLAYNLQSTLDVVNTLELFFSNIQDLFEVNGLSFDNLEGIELKLGSQEKHSACYNVATSNIKLGKIEFRRAKPFLETELTLMEMLIGVLFYPLRNALLYRAALDSSMRDPLTGIGNRQAMDNCFAREIKLSLRHQTPLSLMLIDVDFFKKLNDTYGHRAGDKMLKHIVTNIKNSLRETDQIFRFGGEEFVVLLHNTDAENARLTAERIRIHSAITPMEIDGENVSSTISLGVTTLIDTDNVESFFERADCALYQAKKEGRNKVVVESSNNMRQHNRNCEAHAGQSSTA